MGAIPETLSVEALEGQPMIRREHLEADSEEAPQGQPRKHSRHSKKNSQHKDNGGKGKEKTREGQRPVVITVDEKE